MTRDPFDLSGRTALVPAMKERGWGRIVYVASILGIDGGCTINSF